MWWKSCHNPCIYKYFELLSQVPPDFWFPNSHETTLLIFLYPFFLYLITADNDRIMHNGTVTNITDNLQQEILHGLSCITSVSYTCYFYSCMKLGSLASISVALQLVLFLTHSGECDHSMFSPCFLK